MAASTEHTCLPASGQSSFGMSADSVTSSTAEPRSTRTQLSHPPMLRSLSSLIGRASAGRALLKRPSSQSVKHKQTLHASSSDELGQSLRSSESSYPASETSAATSGDMSTRPSLALSEFSQGHRFENQAGRWQVPSTPFSMEVDDECATSYPHKQQLLQWAPSDLHVRPSQAMCEELSCSSCGRCTRRSKLDGSRNGSLDLERYDSFCSMEQDVIDDFWAQHSFPRQRSLRED